MSNSWVLAPPVSSWALAAPVFLSTCIVIFSGFLHFPPLLRLVGFGGCSTSTVAWGGFFSWFSLICFRSDFTYVIFFSQNGQSNPLDTEVGPIIHLQDGVSWKAWKSMVMSSWSLIKNSLMLHFNQIQCILLDIPLFAFPDLVSTDPALSEAHKTLSNFCTAGLTLLTALSVIFLWNPTIHFEYLFMNSTNRSMGKLLSGCPLRLTNLFHVSWWDTLGGSRCPVCMRRPKNN